MAIRKEKTTLTVHICDGCGVEKPEYLSYGGPQAWVINGDDIKCGDCKELSCIECGRICKVTELYGYYGDDDTFCSKDCSQAWHRKQYTVLCKIGELEIKQYSGDEIGINQSPLFEFVADFVDYEHAEKTYAYHDFIGFMRELATQLNLEFVETRLNKED